MSVTVLIKRLFKREHMESAHQMILKARSLATLEPGYISGQTLVSTDDPNKIIIMSTWDNKSSWQAWKDSDVRRTFANKMEMIMDGPEEHEVFAVLV